jgi:hypothetical protein
MINLRSIYGRDEKSIDSFIRRISREENIPLVRPRHKSEANRRMLRKVIRCESVNRMHIFLDRDQCWALVNTLGFHKRLGIFWTADYSFSKRTLLCGTSWIWSETFNNHKFEVHISLYIPQNKNKTKLRSFSPQENYTDRATAACRRS